MLDNVMQFTILDLVKVLAAVPLAFIAWKGFKLTRAGFRWASKEPSKTTGWILLLATAAGAPILCEQAFSESLGYGFSAVGVTAMLTGLGAWRLFLTPKKIPKLEGEVDKQWLIEFLQATRDSAETAYINGDSPPKDRILERIVESCDASMRKILS